MARSAALALLLLAVLPATLPAAGAGASPPPDLRRADELLAAGRYREAADAFRRADEQSGGACVDCRLGLARASNQLGDHAAALASAEVALRSASSPSQRMLALFEQGIALVSSANANRRTLEQAERAFRRALDESGGRSSSLRYHLGEVLLRLERDPEGIALLEEYLKAEPNGPHAARARRLVAEPIAARKLMLPDLEVITLKGEWLASRELRGKVVLLDFWATWCLPCRETLPHLVTIARRYADDPFVLVSVSGDRDGDALRAFIDSNHMTWPQVWDHQGLLGRSFGVESVPTYVLASHEGEILFVTSGATDRGEDSLSVRVAAAVRAARKAAKPAR